MIGRRQLRVAVVLSVGLLAGSTLSADGVRVVRLQDACNPNGAIPDFVLDLLAQLPFQSGCVPHPHNNSVDLSEFFAALPEGGHQAWRIKAPGHVDEDDTLLVTNEGGIGFGHTFTRVEAFGTTCLPAPIDAFFNQSVQEPLPPQECAFLASERIAPGQVRVISASELGPGVHRFQCLIHPWMRAELEVRPDD